MKINTHQLRTEPTPRQDNTPSPTLLRSVQRRGVLHPLIISPEGDEWVVIKGQRRLQAARAAKIEEIECVVIELDEEGRRELYAELSSSAAPLREIERLDLALERMGQRTGERDPDVLRGALKKLKKDPESAEHQQVRRALSQAAQEFDLGEADSAGLRLLDVARWPEDIQDDWRSARINGQQAGALAKIKDSNLRKALSDKASRGKASALDIQRAAREARAAEKEQSQDDLGSEALDAIAQLQRHARQLEPEKAKEAKRHIEELLKVLRG